MQRKTLGAERTSVSNEISCAHDSYDNGKGSTRRSAAIFGTLACLFLLFPAGWFLAVSSTAPGLGLFLRGSRDLSGGQDYQGSNVENDRDFLFKQLGAETVLNGLRSLMVTSMERAVEACSIAGAFVNDLQCHVSFPEVFVALASTANKFQLGDVVGPYVGPMLISMNDLGCYLVPFAADIFRDVIYKSELTDTRNLYINMRKDACTDYLKLSSKKRFKKLLHEAGNETIMESEFMKKWTGLVHEVSVVPDLGADIAKYDIADYVVEKTLDSLFVKMAIEEVKIRSDPSARTSDVLLKVFDVQG